MELSAYKTSFGQALVSFSLLSLLLYSIWTGQSKASPVCPGWILSSALILCLFSDSITTRWTQEWPHSITNPWCPKLSVYFPFISASVPLSLLLVCGGVSLSRCVTLANACFVLALDFIVLLKPAELRSSKLLQHLTLCNACGSAVAVLTPLNSV